MDRIAAIRNIERAIADFESGEITLTTLQRRVQTVLQTYATDFEDEQTAVYEIDGTVVVAGSPGEARKQAASMSDIDEQQATVRRLSGDE